MKRMKNPERIEPAPGLLGGPQDTPAVSPGRQPTGLTFVGSNRGLQSPKSTSLNFDVEPKLTCSRPPALADGVRWRCSPKAICSSVNLRRNPGGILSLA